MRWRRSGWQVLQRAHVVQPVAELDDDDPRVLGDREQQLPVVLHLLLGGAPEGEAGDLGEAVHDPGDLGAELAGDVLGADVGVLDHVVQQRGGDGGAVEQLLRQDQGHRDAVGDEVLARHPLLAPVGGRAEAEGPIDEIEVQPIGVPFQHGRAGRGRVRAGSRSRLSCGRDSGETPADEIPPPAEPGRVPPRVGSPSVPEFAGGARCARCSAGPHLGWQEGLRPSTRPPGQVPGDRVEADPDREPYPAFHIELKRFRPLANRGW